MIVRHVTAIIALVACTSCLPQAERPHVWARIPDPVRRPADNHQLPHMLALADPLKSPAGAVAAGASDYVAAPPFSVRDAAPEDLSKAADCLAAAVYYEARSEPVDGQRAVAQVVLNRVRDRAFPDSVCRVVYQRPAHGPGCQFSFACDGSTDRPLDGRAWAAARGVALAALSGSVFAPVGSATYYHTMAVLPWWAASLSRIGLIGSHIFYRWRDGLGRALSFRQAYSGVEVQPARMGAAVEPVAVHLLSATVDKVGTNVENGVTIHRSAAALAIKPTPVGLFDVRVHRGTSSDAIGASARSTSSAGDEEVTTRAI